MEVGLGGQLHQTEVLTGFKIFKIFCSPSPVWFMRHVPETLLVV